MVLRFDHRASCTPFNSNCPCSPHCGFGLSSLRQFSFLLLIDQGDINRLTACTASSPLVVRFSLAIG